MTFGSSSGDLTISNQTGFAGLRFTKNYSGILLSLATWALDGDANLDAMVNTIDFNILAANFATSGKNWRSADFNGDSIVDTVDFNLLAANFGQNTPPQAAGMLVPEPSMVCPIFLIMFAQRRSRAQRRAA